MSKSKLPNGISLAGEDYRCVLALINTKDEQGRPKLCAIIYDEMVIDLAGGEEFMTMYIPRIMMRKKEQS